MGYVVDHALIWINDLNVGCDLYYAHCINVHEVLQKWHKSTTFNKLSLFSMFTHGHHT